ncbi:MAG: hypothetical protein PHO01_12200 [Desulfotomaculaceae bacterium]|jgi:hypothetical protein|nr:hypothetical protein [Desulfotomaculaceae bacterium]
MGNDKKIVPLLESCNKPSARIINPAEQRSVDKPSARKPSPQSRPLHPKK